MAKVVGPLHASEARGKMGGLVYNSWRGFATVKAKHAPAQPRTSKQLAVRALAIYCSRMWQACTNKADWNTYAQTHTIVDWTNSPKRLTGANWFTALGVRLLKANVAIVQTPPIVPAPNAVTHFTAIGSADLITLTWTDPGAADDHVEIWLDGPHTAGREGSLPRASYNSTILGNATTKTVAAIPGTYSVYARVRSNVNGLVSVWVSATATVTAV